MLFVALPGLMSIATLPNVCTWPALSVVVCPAMLRVVVPETTVTSTVFVGVTCTSTGLGGVELERAVRHVKGIYQLHQHRLGVLRVGGNGAAHRGGLPGAQTCPDGVGGEGQGFHVSLAGIEKLSLLRLGVCVRIVHEQSLSGGGSVECTIGGNKGEERKPARGAESIDLTGCR